MNQMSDLTNIQELVGGAPEALDTLLELGKALESDHKFSTLVAGLLKPKPEVPRALKIVVTGCDSFNNYTAFSKIMNGLLRDLGDFELVNGGNTRGADNMIAEFARDHGIICRKVAPDWDDITVPGAVVKSNLRMRKYNANALADRDNRLADMADHVIVFWDGKCNDTRNLINTLRAKNVDYTALLVDGDSSLF